MINNAMKFNKVELKVAEKRIEFEKLMNDFNSAFIIECLESYTVKFGKSSQ